MEIVWVDFHPVPEALAATVKLECKILAQHHRVEHRICRRIHRIIHLADQSTYVQYVVIGRVVNITECTGKVTGY